METIRKNLLQIHSILLIIIGIAAAINTTVGLHFDIGPYYFLYNNDLAYIGLFQAYLLVILTGIVLWMGSKTKKRKIWNRIGCLFHFFILIVYAEYWNFFVQINQKEITIYIGFIFHIIFFLLEFWAGFLLNRNKYKMKN